MPEITLELYVCRGTPRAAQAVAQVRRRCKESFHDCDLRIHEVTAGPGPWTKDFVVLTPTLIRRHPAPERRVVGDLSDWQEVLAALELTPTKSSQSGPDVADAYAEALRHPQIRP